MTEVIDPRANCVICEIVPQISEEFVILDGKYWVGNLRDIDQTLLGTTFITLKRHAPELDSLTPEEDAEFLVVRNALIKATRAAFKPLTFNVSCLKNDAFKEDPDNSSSDAAHVHWHMKPRYNSKPVVFAGETFTDPLPGKYLNSFVRHTPAHDTAVQIAKAIRDYL